MNTEESIATRFVVIETIVSFLLARESKLSGVPLDDMHAALASSAAQAVESASGRQDMSVAAERCVDSIYSLASVMASRMQS